MKLDVIIEITKGSRNKYEIDKESGRIKLDRVLKSSVGYPADYGYVEGTLCDDGDALDVMIINRFSTFPGCVVPCRPIAVFKMVDTGDNDEKIIAVPEGDSYYESWEDLQDIPEALTREIEEFFKTYKNLEKNKKVEPKGWGDAKEAEAVISKSYVKK
ncbi:MAG: inorganic pyrophosphatase [Candidatus Colwellbacteria bacterium RIFCSPLOWO2_01_FULL_48_10]|uniref:Inorganic pyrophosphatase n=1 Tax=Candidatus Colwellbacteria bacterium RIFCSPLOWO2_01_FULL_48_10 TaxID=1797690 RepID=A0A1G1Z6X6_9BACT|nr:MAG: inorganic pyrophosphatase [Candidatus Colwellbacteria bacterium RIFCSPLOWO2_01_FULL_48_10]